MKKCEKCEGTGKTPLLTSLIDCETCKGRGHVGSVSNEVKQRLISEYLRTPEGRARLAASISRVKRCGGRDYPSKPKRVK